MATVAVTTATTSTTSYILTTSNTGVVVNTTLLQLSNPRQYPNIAGHSYP